MEETGRSIVIYSNDTLAHHGVKGQKWYKRNYQNEDGTLTAEGRIHYGYGQSRIAKGVDDSSSVRPVNQQQPTNSTVSSNTQSRILRMQRRQKWGTNLTGKDPSTMTTQELDAEMARARKEKEFYNLQQESRPERFTKAKNIAKQFVDKSINKLIEKGSEKLTQLAVDKATDWLTEKLGANPNNHVDLANVDLTNLSDKQVQAMAQRQENENKINNAKDAFEKKVDAAARAKIEEMKKEQNGGNDNGNNGDKNNKNSSNENKDEKKSDDNTDSNQSSDQPKKSKAERKREAREAREKQEREAKEKQEQSKPNEDKDNKSESSNEGTSNEKSKSPVPTLDFSKKSTDDEGYKTADEKELAEMRRGLAVVNRLLGNAGKEGISSADVRRIRELTETTEEFQKNKKLVARILSSGDIGENFGRDKDASHVFDNDPIMVQERRKEVAKELTMDFDSLRSDRQATATRREAERMKRQWDARSLTTFEKEWNTAKTAKETERLIEELNKKWHGG